MAFRFDVLKIRFVRPVIDRKDWVKYLVLVNWHAGRLGDIINKPPDAAFNRFLESQVQAYLGGKKVTAAIEPAIMNIADDYLAGREVTVRAGDYVALQTQFRAQK